MKFVICRMLILAVVIIGAGCGNLTEPSGFSFVTQTGVPTSTVISSNVVTIKGNQFPAPITITNGEYSINGAGFTGGVLGDQLNPGNTLQVQQTSSSTVSTSNVTTVTVGGFTTTFTTITGTSGGAVTDPTKTVTISNLTASLNQNADKNNNPYVNFTISATTSNVNPLGNPESATFTIQAISNTGAVVAQYVVSSTSPVQIPSGTTPTIIFPVGATVATLPTTAPANLPNAINGFLPTSTNYWAQTISYWQIEPGTLMLL